MRTIDEILTGDALTWSLLDAEQLRHEHEALRQALLTARAQIALWAPLVAYRHRTGALARLLARLTPEAIRDAMHRHSFDKSDGGACTIGGEAFYTVLAREVARIASGR